MARTALLAALLLLAAMPAPAQTAPAVTDSVAASDLSAQSRPRARLRVYPGRLLYRECVFKLVQEWRPSGTFIVPRQRCWWVRG